MPPPEATQPIIKMQYDNNETAMNVIKSKARHTCMKYEDLYMLSDRGIIHQLVTKPRKR